jgi:hypothetical protein
MQCPSCEHGVSKLARTCPQCGHPFAVEQAPRTIEQTSKRFKGGQLLGLALIGLGFLVLFAGRSSNGGAGAVDRGAPLLGLGVLVYLAARLGAWWRNG